MTAEPIGPPSGAGLPGGSPPGAGLPGGSPPGAGLPGELPAPAAGDLCGGCEEPWWLPPAREPSDAELHGAWPDPFAGPPDAESWLSQMEAAEEQRTDLPASAGFAEGGPADEMAPGPVLALLSQQALDAGLETLPDHELVGMLRAARRLASWQAAVELLAVSRLDARRREEAERPGSSRVSEHVSAELAAALALTGRSADELLGLARALARLPGVLSALLAGRIDRARAGVFAAEVASLDDLTAAAVAAALVGVAGSMTTGQLRAALRSLVLAIDPDAARRRAEAGRADARVEWWNEGSGNAALAGRELRPAEVIAADARLTAIARVLQEAGAPGGIDALRAAVYTALLTGRDPATLIPSPADASGQSQLTGHSDQPAGHPGLGERPWAGASPAAHPGSLTGLSGSVHLVMPASAWLGLTDAPGEVTGHGPVAPTTAGTSPQGWRPGRAPAGA
jgi:hypothetical protein